MIYAITTTLLQMATYMEMEERRTIAPPVKTSGINFFLKKNLREMDSHKDAALLKLGTEAMLRGAIYVGRKNCQKRNLTPPFFKSIYRQ